MSPRSASHRPRHDWRVLRDVSPTGVNIRVRVIIRHGCMESTWLSTHHMEGIRPSARGCHKPIAVGESH